jgi:hypothetical protein
MLAPLEMSVPAGDGLILKGTLTYPADYAGAGFRWPSLRISIPRRATATHP